MDWSELTVLLRPMAQELEGHMNRREYAQAELVAAKLGDVVNDLYRLAIRSQIISGVGYK